MFGNLVQKLQSLSPLTSPTTSPTVSPRPKRKFVFGRANRKRRIGGYAKEDLREVQSEPELDYDNPEKSKRDKSFFGLSEKRKSSAPLVPSISSPIQGFTITPSAYFHESTGHLASSVSTGAKCNIGSNPSKGIYSSIPCSSTNYPTVSRSVNGTANLKSKGNSIYEDVYPLKGPHISIYNISNNPPKSSVINVNINSSEMCKPRTEVNTHVSKVNVPEYVSCRSGVVNVTVCPKKSVAAASVSIYESLKTIDCRNESHEQPKSLPDQNKINKGITNTHEQLRRISNHNGSIAQIRPKFPLPAQSIHIHNFPGSGVSRRAVGNQVQRCNDPKKLAVHDSRKTSYEPKKPTPPEYHRTLSSDYYKGSGIYGYINRVDEPYPLPPSPHEDIYDVPNRIAREVDASRSRERTQHISRTVGKMEGLRQV